MAQLIGNLSYVTTSPPPLPLRPTEPTSTSLRPHHFTDLRLRLHRSQLNCSGRFTCLLWDNTGKQEQAKKALESALSGKKNEFEKWNKEIKKKEEIGGGNNNSGGGGWFGWSRRFGDDHFWQQTQQTSLAVLCIIVMYVLLSKGETLFAVVFNPLLFALRRTRSSFTYVISWISRKVYPAGVTALENMQKEQEQAYIVPSAKERVLKKWGSD